MSQEDDDKRPPEILLFLSAVPVGKGDMVEILSFTGSMKHIVVYANVVSLQAIRMLEAHESDKFCEVLNAKDVEFDKCSNVLVPTYRKLNPNEVKDIEKLRATSVDKFPRMFRSDPMARYLGFNVGDVVLAVETSCYRLVVKG